MSNAEVAEFVAEIRSEAATTGREPREIIQAMIDEGYLAVPESEEEEFIRRVLAAGAGTWPSRPLAQSGGD